VHRSESIANRTHALAANLRPSPLPRLSLVRPEAVRKLLFDRVAIEPKRPSLPGHPPKRGTRIYKRQSSVICAARSSAPL
jgi:hypothetical protein